jgi:hypothetical protein
VSCTFNLADLYEEVADAANHLLSMGSTCPPTT